MKKKAFTLVEVTVSLFVASIIMIFAGGWILSSGKYLDLTERKNESKMIGDTVLEFLTERIQYSGKIKISASADVDDFTNEISSDTSKILLNGTDIYADKFYSGRKVDYYIDKISDSSMNLSVQVTDGDIVYKTETVVSFTNLEISGNTLDCSLDTTMDNPYIFFNKAETLEVQDSLYIPGTDVPYNGSWPSIDEFTYNEYEDGYICPDIPIGTTFLYEGKSYIIMQYTGSMWLKGMEPTPENYIKYNPDYIYTICPIDSYGNEDVFDYPYYPETDTVESYEIRKNYPITIGKVVRFNGEYYVWANKSGYWGDIPGKSNNYALLQ